MISRQEGGDALRSVFSLNEHARTRQAPERVRASRNAKGSVFVRKEEREREKERKAASWRQRNLLKKSIFLEMNEPFTLPLTVGFH